MKYQMSDMENELNCSASEIEELEHTWFEHDCHLSAEDGCEVCNKRKERKMKEYSANVLIYFEAENEQKAMDKLEEMSENSLWDIYVDTKIQETGE